MGDAVESLRDLSGEPTPLAADPAATPTPPPPFAEWEAQRQAALAIAARPGAVAATALTDEGTPDHSPDWISATAPAPVQPSLFDTAAPPAQPWGDDGDPGPVVRSDVHTSELQSLILISY